MRPLFVVTAAVEYSIFARETALAFSPLFLSLSLLSLETQILCALSLLGLHSTGRQRQGAEQSMNLSLRDL
jgi:hypothetical protein